MWYHHRSRIWHKLLFMIWCRQNASNSPVRWWIHKFYVSILNDWTLFLEYVAKNNLCASILLRNYQRFYCLILVVLLHGILFLLIFSVDDADQQYYKLDRMFTQHEQFYCLNDFESALQYYVSKLQERWPTHIKLSVWWARMGVVYYVLHTYRFIFDAIAMINWMTDLVSPGNHLRCNHINNISMNMNDAYVFRAAQDSFTRSYGVSMYPFGNCQLANSHASQPASG